MNTNTATQTTVTSAYGKVLEVTISAGRQVRTVSGVFLGEVDDMVRIGWDFA